MFGVVSWSDNIDRKAVIWCEDHGNLAFFSGQHDSAYDGQALDTGDLVQFEMTQDRHMRYARNPRVVAEDQYPALVPGLRSSVTPLAQRTDCTGSVVSFSRPAKQPGAVQARSAFAH